MRKGLGDINNRFTHLVGGDRKGGREGLDAVRAGERGRLGEIVAEATDATRTFLRFVLVARGDFAKPLLVIVRKRGETNAVMLRQFFRLMPALLELLARVDVRVGEEHRHLMPVVFEARHAGARTGSAAGVEDNRRRFTDCSIVRLFDCV